MSAIEEIQNERRRQVDVEGYTSESDDKYTNNELARAAHCYVDPLVSEVAPPFWPWSSKWWNPKSYRENLIRAGALIVAEIDRIDRIEKK